MWAKKGREKEEEEEGERKPFAWRIYCKPLRSPVIEGSSHAPEVPGVSQRHSGSTYPPGQGQTENCMHTHIHAVMHVCIHPKKSCHSTAPAGNTKATSSHCVRPSPLIPFSTACTTTKAEKLGSCVDDRATNLFGGTQYISSLYSLPAERGELNMDMQRWASLWRQAHQQCHAITSGIIHTFHMGQMPWPDDHRCICSHIQLIQGQKWFEYLQNICLFCHIFCFKPVMQSSYFLKGSCLDYIYHKRSHDLALKHILLCSRLRLLGSKGEVIT